MRRRTDAVTGRKYAGSCGSPKGSRSVSEKHSFLLISAHFFIQRKEVCQGVELFIDSAVGTITVQGKDTMTSFALWLMIVYYGYCIFFFLHKTCELNKYINKYRSINTINITWINMLDNNSIGNTLHTWQRCNDTRSAIGHGPDTLINVIKRRDACRILSCITSEHVRKKKKKKLYTHFWAELSAWWAGSPTAKTRAVRMEKEKSLFLV